MIKEEDVGAIEEKTKNTLAVMSQELVPFNIAETFIIYCVNEAVFTFAEQRNIPIPDDGGFSLPYVLLFSDIFRKRVPYQWALDYTHWAINEAVGDFAKKHKIAFTPDDNFAKQFTGDFDNLISSIKAK